MQSVVALPIRISLCVLLCLTCITTVIHYNSIDSDLKVTKPSLQERVIGRSEHEHLITHDMSTGDIPSERLFAAKQYIQKRLDRKLKNAIPNINWAERGPNNIAGRTRAILIDKNDSSNNTIWAGGVSGGLWKSTDGGDTWTAIDDFFDNLAISALVQHPIDLDTMYFGTGEFFGGGVRGLGIWRTMDGGDTWTHLTSTQPGNTAPNFSFNFVTELAISNEGTLFATTSGRFCNTGGILRSTDQGATWTRFGGIGVPGSCGGNFKLEDAGDIEVAANGDLYASMGLFEKDGIYKSTDDGLTWNRVYENADNERWIELAVAPSDANRIYALIQSIDSQIDPGLKKSTNGGTTWTDMANPGWIEDQQNCAQVSSDWTRGQSFYDMAVAVDPADANKLMIGGVDLFKSNNGGDSWSQISSWFGGCNYPFVHADQHFIKYVDSNTAWFGHDGGINMSANVNAAQPTFTYKGNGYNVTQFYSADINPQAGSNNYQGGTQDNGSLKLNAAGLTSAVTVSGGDGAFSHIDQTNGNLQTSAFIHNVYYATLDNWTTKFTAEIPGQDNGLFINPTDLDDNSKKLYCSFGDNSYLRWEDIPTSGTTLTKVTVSGMDSKATSVRVSPNVDNRVYFGLISGKVIRVDNGNTGTSKTGTVIFSELEGSGVISCIEIEPGNENHILVTSSNYGATSVYESINANSATPTWTAVEGNLPDMPVRWAMFDPNNADQALIATELGVWSTTDLNGSTTDWDPTNTGLANTRVDMIKYRASDKQMVAATHGRGIFTANDFAGGPVCAITALAAGTQSPCDSSSDTFNQDITVTFSNPPGAGMLVVNGQNFSIGTSPQTVTLTGLRADGNQVNVVAAFSLNSNCTITQNNLFTAPQPCGNSVCQTYTSVDIPKNIADGELVTSSIVVNTAGLITDVNVLDITGTHSYVGDLEMSLASPSGTVVRLVESDVMCNTADFAFSLDDDVTSNPSCPHNGGPHKPLDLLSAFDNQDAAGTWVLSIGDLFQDDTGQLAGWKLEVCALAVSDCSDYVINGTIASGTYRSDNEITSSGTVGSSNNVIFKAENGVNLQSNFNIQNTGAITVDIVEDCNEN